MFSGVPAVVLLLPGALLSPMGFLLRKERFNLLVFGLMALTFLLSAFFSLRFSLFSNSFEKQKTAFSQVVSLVDEASAEQTGSVLSVPISVRVPGTTFSVQGKTLYMSYGDRIFLHDFEGLRVSLSFNSTASGSVALDRHIYWAAARHGAAGVNLDFLP